MEELTSDISAELKNNVAQNLVSNNGCKCDCNCIKGIKEFRQALDSNCQKIYTFEPSEHTIKYFFFNIISFNPYLLATIKNIKGTFVEIQVVNLSKYKATFNIQYIMYF